MSGKPDIRNMTPEEKWQYFKDYYLLKTVIGVCILIGAAIFLRDLLTPDPVYALQIGIYDTSLTDEEKESLAYKIQKQIRVYDEVGIDDAYSSLNDQDLMRIVSLSENRKLDLIIAPRTVFEWLAGYGYFKDLRQECGSGFTSANDARFIECRGLAAGEGGMLGENAEGSGEYYTAGISAEGTLFEPFLHGMEEPVIGVIYESEHLPYFEILAE